MKIFKKRIDDKPYVSLDKTDNKEQSDKDCGDAEIEESGLQLIIDIRDDSKIATDEEDQRASGSSTHTGGCAGLEGVSVVV